MSYHLFSNTSFAGLCMADNSYNLSLIIAHFKILLNKNEHVILNLVKIIFGEYLVFMEGVVSVRVSAL